MKLLLVYSIITMLAVAACGTVEEEVANRSEIVENTLPEGIIDLNNQICPVMQDGVMEGEYIDWEGYRIHFCCAGCDQDFRENPQQYLAVLVQDPSVTVDLSDLLISTSMADNTDSTNCVEGEMCEACEPMANDQPTTCH